MVVAYEVLLPPTTTTPFDKSSPSTTHIQLTDKKEKLKRHLGFDEMFSFIQFK